MTVWPGDISIQPGSFIADINPQCVQSVVGRNRLTQILRKLHVVFMQRFKKVLLYVAVLHLRLIYFQCPIPAKLFRPLIQHQN